MSYSVVLKQGGRKVGHLGPFATKAVADRQAAVMRDMTGPGVTCSVVSASKNPSKSRRRNPSSVAQLLQQSPIPWTKIEAMGVDPRDVAKEARAHGDEALYKRAMARVKRRRGASSRNPKAAAHPKVLAYSKERYRASAAEKRRYGGSTITIFYVMFKGDEKSPSKWVEMKGFGKTPGERKTDAMQRALPLLLEKRGES